MRVLVVGSAGMLSRDLVPVLTGAGHDVIGVDRDDLDITDAGACRARVAGSAAQVVVNTAAWTAVDAAEEQEAEAFAVNAAGAANLAAAAEAAGAEMLHVSTDYVFAGDATTPYPVDAPIAPRSAYGRTKAAGEWAVRANCSRTRIVRTAWLYGAGGPNFVTTMARLAAERDTLTVVDDQVGQPTWTRDLAVAIAALVGSDAPYGIYHGTSQGQVSWYGFARAIFTGLGLDPERVRPVTSAEFVRPAPRPAYSVLDHACWAAAGLAPLPHWEDALARALPELPTQR